VIVFGNNLRFIDFFRPQTPPRTILTITSPPLIPLRGRYSSEKITPAHFIQFIHKRMLVVKRTPPRHLAGFAS
ncbi:hypothetical protein, partial [Zooshikella ganghwensis]|uniref:hypothetical protein n=1 Tax=Zooshikella ganghwensis TaxID=202772 RepID=UPI001B7FCA01